MQNEIPETIEFFTLDIESTKLIQLRNREEDTRGYLYTVTELTFTEMLEAYSMN